MAKTSIEWAQAVWNPISGCSRKSAGCENCYAEKMTKRLAAMGQEKYQGLLNEQNRFNGTVKFAESDLLKPLWIKKPTTFFVNSMSDLFHENVKDEWIDKTFAVMVLAYRHTFQVLTKRPERMKEYFAVGKDALIRRWSDISYEFGLTRTGKEDDGDIDAVPCDVNNIADENFPLPNVWLGVSCENQQTADQRIPYLLDTPAAIRFLSCEPLLGEIDLSFYFPKKAKADCTVDELPYYNKHFPIDWTIVGGESGANARPCSVDWIRSIVRQCQNADVPVFVKQLGSVPMIYESDWQSGCTKPLLNSNNRKKVLDGYLPLYQSSKKGGDISEFPEDLQIRQFPKI